MASRKKWKKKIDPSAKPYLASSAKWSGVVLFPGAAVLTAILANTSNSNSSYRSLYWASRGANMATGIPTLLLLIAYQRIYQHAIPRRSRSSRAPLLGEELPEGEINAKRCPPVCSGVFLFIGLGLTIAGNLLELSPGFNLETAQATFVGTTLMAAGMTSHFLNLALTLCAFASARKSAQERHQKTNHKNPKRSKISRAASLTSRSSEPITIGAAPRSPVADVNPLDAIRAIGEEVADDPTPLPGNATTDGTVPIVVELSSSSGSSWGAGPGSWARGITAPMHDGSASVTTITGRPAREAEAARAAAAAAPHKDVTGGFGSWEYGKGTPAESVGTRIAALQAAAEAADDERFTM